MGACFSISDYEFYKLVVHHESDFLECIEIEKRNRIFCNSYKYLNYDFYKLKEDNDIFNNSYKLQKNASIF